MIAFRASALLISALAACVVLQPSRAQAQWWSHAPVDFEDCADAAEQAATKEAKTAALTECNAKFAGRRKPGGGYTYFDFMQNRSFDIAGPNPTPEEQKQIDQQYTAYLDSQRQSSIAAAFTAKQQQLQLQQAAFESGNERATVTTRSVAKPIAKPQAAAPNNVRPRAKTATCAQPSFSCDWPRLSEGLKDLKNLFSPSPSSNKPKRG